MNWNQIGNGILLALAIVEVIFGCYYVPRNFSFVWQVWSRFRISMFIEVTGLVIVSFLTFIILVRWMPFLGWGWLNLLGQSGNAKLSPFVNLQHSSSIWERSFAVLFFGLILLVLPHWAELEEDWFRKGRVTWNAIIKASLLFGLVHLLVGVPLGAAISLSGTGCYFGWKYRQAYLNVLSSFNNFE